MKKIILFSMALMVVLSPVVANEEKAAEKEAKVDEKNAKVAELGEEYRRSSLCLIMAKDNDALMASVIEEAFLNTPVPDKYNDHNIGERIFSVQGLEVTEDDMALFKEAVLLGSVVEKAEEADEEAEEGEKKKGGFGALAGSVVRSVASEETGGLVSEAAKDEVAALAYKYLHKYNFASEVAAHWFGGTEQNTPELIWNRGLYDASALKIEEASATLFGNDELTATGFDLIPKTFTVVSRYEYLSKDELVAQLEKTIMLAAEVSAKLVDESKRGIIMMSAKAAVTALKASLGTGYYVKTRSFLFQLEWNEDIFQLVDETLWNNPEAWEANKDKFKLKYIGCETAWANTKAGIFTDKSESELIRIATINAMDNVLAKLEKKYEVFKTKVPLIVEEVGEGKKATQMLTAKVGMKEDLSGGEKFEVLEVVTNEETRRIKYKKVGTIKVDKSQVWDNRYMADVEAEATNATTQACTATKFDGGKAKFYSGLLLRQIR